MKYDVIVIGAGSGGGTLAARLSESPERSVLLLEAGPDYTDFEEYPDDLKFGYAPTASVMGAPHNWSLMGTSNSSQPEPINVPRGKVVGGTMAEGVRVAESVVQHQRDAAFRRDRHGDGDSREEPDLFLRARAQALEFDGSTF